MPFDCLPVPGGIGLSDQDPDALRAENRHWMRHGRYIPDCGDCEDLRKLRERAEKAEADLARLRGA